MMATNANDRSSSDSVVTNTNASTNNSNSRTRTMYLEPALPLRPGRVYGADYMTNGISCDGQFHDLPSITGGTPYGAISDNPLRDFIATYNYEVNVAYDANVIDVIPDIEKQIFRDIAEASPLFADGDITEVICNKLLANALGIPYEDPNAGANPDDERVDDDDTPITMSPTPESDPADPDGRFNKLRRRNRNLTRARNSNSSHTHRHQIRNLELNGEVNDYNEWISYLGIKSVPNDTIKISSACKSEPVPGTTCYPIIGYTTAQTPVDDDTIDEQGVEMQILQKIKESMQANKYVSADVPSMSFIGIEGEVYSGGAGTDVAPGGGGIDTGGSDTTGGDEVIIKPEDPEDTSLNDNLFTGLGIFFMVALALSVGMTASIFGVRMKRRRERLGKMSKEKKFKEFQDDAIAMGKGEGSETEAMNMTPKQLLVAPSSDSVEIVDMNNPNTGGPNWSITCNEGLTSIGALMDSFRRTDDDGISASGTSNDKNGAGSNDDDDDDDLSVETKEYDDARLLEDPPTPTRMRSFIGMKK